jgi:hypothetical protein
MNEWITEQELKTAKGMASEIFTKFCKDKQGCESDWVEIEINGKFFDIECFDDDMDKERTDTFCAIYPVCPTECGKYRETDCDRWVRLFTFKDGSLMGLEIN